MKKLIAIAFALIIVSVYSTSTFASFSKEKSIETLAKKVYGNDNLVFVMPDLSTTIFETIVTSVRTYNDEIVEPLQKVEQKGHSPPLRKHRYRCSVGSK